MWGRTDNYTNLVVRPQTVREALNPFKTSLLLQLSVAIQLARGGLEGIRPSQFKDYSPQTLDPNRDCPTDEAGLSVVVSPGSFDWAV